MHRRWFPWEKGGLLWLLESDQFKVQIPDRVADEIMAKPTDPAAQWLMGRASELKVPSGMIDPLLLAWDLGAGETGVIACGSSNSDTIVVLDDLAALRCAQALGLRCTGTLGLLLMAKQRGLLPGVLPAVNRLRESGLYVSDALLSLRSQRSPESDPGSGVAGQGNRCPVWRSRSRVSARSMGRAMKWEFF